MFNVFFDGEEVVITDEEEDVALTNFVEAFEYALDKELVLGEIFRLNPGFDPDRVTAFVNKNWGIIIERAKEIRETYSAEYFDVSFFDATVEDFINDYIEQGE